MRGKHLLYASDDARKALSACREAKEVLIGTFANFTAVRRRVLQVRLHPPFIIAMCELSTVWLSTIVQWWSDVSETDADFIPELNSRVLLVCGGEPEDTSDTIAAADRYLAAAFAYQFVQAAEVDLPVEGTTRYGRGCLCSVGLVLTWVLCFTERLSRGRWSRQRMG